MATSSRLFTIAEDKTINMELEEKLVNDLAQWASKNQAGYGDDDEDIWFEDLPHYTDLEWKVRMLIREALTQAHQAGRDEVVEIVKKLRNTDSCIGISGLHHAEEKRVYNQALDDTITALQDNK